MRDGARIKWGGLHDWDEDRVWEKGVGKRKKGLVVASLGVSHIVGVGQHPPKGEMAAVVIA